jgi:cell division septation protein DedD
VVIARTVGIFLALAVLSFVLGFFVLAKLVPGAPRTPMASVLPATDLSSPGSPETGVPADNSRDVRSGSGHATTPAQVATSHKTTRTKSGLGPSLDPENGAPMPAESTEVQAPRRVNPDGKASRTPSDPPSDTASTGDASDEQKPKPTLTARTKRRRHAVSHKTEKVDVTSDEATTGSDESTSNASDSASANPRRSRRAATSADDNNDNSDASSAEPDRSGPNKKEDTSGRGTLYHVRLGAFHSLEAAHDEVERARAKGFPTRVVPVTRRGRTLYRVQAGAFRDRDRAEAVKQSLQDASLDASVSEQRR